MQLSYFVLISIPFSLVTALGSSVYAGRSGNFKSVLLFSNSVIVLALLGFVFLYRLGSFWIFGVILVVLSAIGAVVFSVG